jgi:hypothetical protein
MVVVVVVSLEPTDLLAIFNCDAWKSLQESMGDARRARKGLSSWPGCMTRPSSLPSSKQHAHAQVLKCVTTNFEVKLHLYNNANTIIACMCYVTSSKGSTSWLQVQ